MIVTMPPAPAQPPPAGPASQPTQPASTGPAQPLPGLVVTVPPATQAAPPQPPPKAATPVKAAPPKPKPATPAPTTAKAKAPVGAPGASGAGWSAGQSIVVLVNDDPITAFEIDQRARFLSLQANVGSKAQENMQRLVKSEETAQRWRKIVEQTVAENQGKTREQILAILEKKKQAFGQQLRDQAISSAKASVLPTLRKSALDELIEERLKLQEAKRLNVLAEDRDVDTVVKSIAERNKMSEAEFAKHLGGMGTDIAVMKSRYKATLSWNEVVRRRFGRTVNVNERDIERYVAKSPKGEEQVELEVRRLTVPMAQTKSIEQKVMAQRLDDAEKLRRSVKDCRSLPALAASGGAKHEDLGVRRAATIPEPARTMLLNAQEGEAVPPMPTATGLEIFVLCGRKVITADESKRTEVASELRQQEFELLARRHLKDLKEDAHIEYR
jgi:peptidyl-prolyl cis-trans isomerase SurA